MKLHVNRLDLSDEQTVVGDRTVLVIASMRVVSDGAAKTQ
jgi:hypothetical protein